MRQLAVLLSLLYFGGAWAADGDGDALLVDQSGDVTIMQDLTVAGSLQLTTGVAATAIHDDPELGAGSPTAIPTERAVKAYVDASGIPAGAVCMFAMTEPPAGWLKANGAAVSREEYAALFSNIGTTYGQGNGSTTFNLPDLRGEFLRGVDDGRGVDAGRAIGTGQPDALQNLTGSFALTDDNSPGMYVRVRSASGAFGTSNVSGNHVNSKGVPGGKSVPSVVNFDASRIARTANETRPRNVALMSCIKY